LPAVETGLGATYGYSYSYTYAPATGTPTSISYPAGGGLVTEELTTDYDPTTGMPVRLDTSLTGSAGTMATTTYTALGERLNTVYGLPGQRMTQEITYRDDATRRVTRTLVEPLSGTVTDRNYTYDHIGNLTSIADTPRSARPTRNASATTCSAD
jgi:hypothetical protein